MYIFEPFFLTGHSLLLNPYYFWPILLDHLTMTLIIVWPWPYNTFLQGFHTALDNDRITVECVHRVAKTNTYFNNTPVKELVQYPLVLSMQKGIQGDALHSLVWAQLERYVQPESEWGRHNLPYVLRVDQSYQASNTKKTPVEDVSGPAVRTLCLYCVHVGGTCWWYSWWNFQYRPKYESVCIVHGGGTRGGTSNTDHSMNMPARITLTVEVIRTCVFWMLIWCVNTMTDQD